MKAICTKENFKRSISQAERMVSKQNTLPILNTILFEAEKGSLKLSATNLEMGIVIKTGAKVEKEGIIAVPSKLISSFSANISDGDNVEIELEDQNLRIRCGKTKALIKSFLANDFPLIPKRSSDNLLGLPVEDLKKIINRTAISVSHGEARQELCGINVVFETGMVRFASTDSFRLTECVVPIEESNKGDKASYEAFVEKNGNVIVPANTLIEIGRIISNAEAENVNIAIEESQIFFEVGNARIVSRLINGKYPEYRHIMPAAFKTIAIGSRERMQNAVKMASIFSSNKTSEISLKIDQDAGNFQIGAKSSESGENSTELDFEASGESQEILFNSRYVLDGLNMITSENVAVMANSEASPVALKEVDGSGKAMEGYVYIVMPIKN